MSLKVKTVVLAALFLGLIGVVLPYLAYRWFAPVAPPPLVRGAGRGLAALGAALALSCVLVFLRRGQGTPAPIQPPVRLVTSGPYGLTRNPMLTGVAALLAGEALALGSLGIALYAAGFLLVAHVLILKVEEPELARRFGEEYAAYRRRVPRWLPRLRRWPSRATGQPPPA